LLGSFRTSKMCLFLMNRAFRLSFFKPCRFRFPIRKQLNISANPLSNPEIALSFSL